MSSGVAGGEKAGRGRAAGPRVVCRDPMAWIDLQEGAVKPVEAAGQGNG